MKIQDHSLHNLICAFVLVLCPAIAIAQSTPPATPPPATPQTAAPAATQSPDALPDAPSTIAHELPPALPTGPSVLFDTTMGLLTCKLFYNEAPVTWAS